MFISLVSYRETAANVLIGIVLLLVFAVLVLVPVLAISYIFMAAQPILVRLSSRFGFSENLLLYALIVASALWSAVAQLRRRFWRNAFLSFAVTAMAILGSLAKIPQNVGLGSGWLCPLLLLSTLRLHERLCRWEFVWGSIIAGTAILLSTGLFGSGAAARIFADAALFATIGLLAAQIRIGLVPWRQCKSAHQHH